MCFYFMVEMCVETDAVQTYGIKMDYNLISTEVTV